MSQRERPGVASAHSPASADTPATRPASPRNGEAAPGTDWESLFPAQADADRFRSFLAALQHGSPADLLPQLRPEPLDALDSELDASQVDAVTRAIQTPDVALIGGGPGTGKSRVIAEIIRQVVRRGQRVLLTSPTAAGLDVVMTRLTSDDTVVAARNTPDLHRELLEQATARNQRNRDGSQRRLTQARADARVMARL